VGGLFVARLLAHGNAAAAYQHGLKERILIIEFPSLGEGNFSAR
jgi:hypothetical protein